MKCMKRVNEHYKFKRDRIKVQHQEAFRINFTTEQLEHEADQRR